MRIRKRPPAHPGNILKHHYLEPLSISVAKLTEIIGVSRKTMSKIVNGRGSITSDMALRLSRAFQTSPDLWVNLQKEYDLWHAAYASKEWKRVKPIKMTVTEDKSASLNP